MSETWIVYKAETMSSRDWEERKLLPSGGLTDILTESWDSSGVLPAVGDRVREYTNLADQDNGITHGREGDWLINRIHQFSSFDTEQRIIVCYCSYQPVAPEWQELPRVSVMTEAV